MDVPHARKGRKDKYPELPDELTCTKCNKTITIQKGVLAQRITKLGVLADDYIKKPFSSKELLARMRAVLQRSKASVQGLPKGFIECGDMSINLPKRRVRLGDRDVHLTPTEYKLLHELATHCNQVLLHEQLLTAVWGQEYLNDFDYLRSYIHLLRRKLEADPSNPKMIVRVPGVGYMLETGEDEI